LNVARAILSGLFGWVACTGLPIPRQANTHCSASDDTARSIAVDGMSKCPNPARSITFLDTHEPISDADLYTQ
jgi:hypothetical protein